MQLTVNGQEHPLIPIQTFREKWALPDNFTLSAFEPKDWAVGSMDRAGQSLLKMKQAVIDAVPAQMSWSALPVTAGQITEFFRQQLTLINQDIGLQDIEVDFAAAGFGDVLQTVIYELLRLKQVCHRDITQIRHEFDFSAVYQRWLDDSVRVSAVIFPYSHAGRQFTLRTINNAYGRVGLEVQTPNGLEYVVDSSLACPAANYMRDLSRDIAAALLRALPY
ncbi:MAG: hypothetical protein H6631_13985 [Anaerolineaceae bacterium]|nr:hypothetical protein [Anaerolineaceae bacterium]MCB9098332.1 hypothetical protein [Anaerolineales bacterium]